MDYIVQPEDKQDLLDLTELLKSVDTSEHQELAGKMLWYVRGQKDALMVRPSA